MLVLMRNKLVNIMNFSETEIKSYLLNDILLGLKIMFCPMCVHNIHVEKLRFVIYCDQSLAFLGFEIKVNYLPLRPLRGARTD